MRTVQEKLGRDVPGPGNKVIPQKKERKASKEKFNLELRRGINKT